MSGPLQAPEPGKVWKKVGPSEASAGYDLAANVFVGLAIGWGLHKLWPGLKPWGYVIGIVLGMASGFYQLFKTQNRRSTIKKPE